MNINKLIAACRKPELYTPGSCSLTDNDHILKQTLYNQLNPDTDYSSRKADTIRKTFDWIMSRSEISRGSMLDIGCGPGLYTELFAGEGFKSVGIDISGPAIKYAGEQAEAKNLDIDYQRIDYRHIAIKGKFDLVIMIYNMFCSLLPDERKNLLGSVSGLLKPDGVFVFDVINDKNMEDKVPPPAWHAAEKSYWSPDPHLYLRSSFLYEKEKVILVRHLVSGPDESINSFNFWVHHFSHADLDNILMEAGFRPVCYSEEVIPENNFWDGSNITFAVAKKEDAV